MKFGQSIEYNMTNINAYDVKYWHKLRIARFAKVIFN